MFLVGPAATLLPRTQLQIIACITLWDVHRTLADHDRVRGPIGHIGRFNDAARTSQSAVCKSAFQHWEDCIRSVGVRTGDRVTQRAIVPEPGPMIP